MARRATSRVRGLAAMLVLAVAVSVPFALDRVKARFVTELPVHADRDGFPRGELRG